MKPESGLFLRLKILYHTHLYNIYNVLIKKHHGCHFGWRRLAVQKGCEGIHYSQAAITIPQ